MGAEVRKLRADPVDDVVRLLEEKLGEARAGQIRAIGIVTVRPGGVIGTAWERGDGGTYLHELTAGATYLQHRIAGGAIED